MPPGPAGRLAVRDATVCGDEWVLVGGVFMTDDLTRPALWSSPDGTTWTSRPVEPHDYWAQRSVLSSVACQEDGTLAMIGGKSGGAHGNPRVSSWYQREDGVYVDVVAGYTLYGGAEATNVSRMAAGPDGFLISGNRVSGAAVWTSPDAWSSSSTTTSPSWPTAPAGSPSRSARSTTARGGRWSAAPRSPTGWPGSRWPGPRPTASPGPRSASRAPTSSTTSSR